MIWNTRCRREIWSVRQRLYRSIVEVVVLATVRRTDKPAQRMNERNALNQKKKLIRLNGTRVRGHSMQRFPAKENKKNHSSYRLLDVVDFLIIYGTSFIRHIERRKNPVQETKREKTNYSVSSFARSCHCNNTRNLRRAADERHTQTILVTANRRFSSELRRKKILQSGLG